jgi:hypothetical protein
VSAACTISDRLNRPKRAPAAGTDTFVSRYTPHAECAFFGPLVHLYRTNTIDGVDLLDRDYVLLARFIYTLAMVRSCAHILRAPLCTVGDVRGTHAIGTSNVRGTVHVGSGAHVSHSSIRSSVGVVCAFGCCAFGGRGH